jgi:hypothetical protein
MLFHVGSMRFILIFDGPSYFLMVLDESLLVQAYLTLLMLVHVNSYRIIVILVGSSYFDAGQP